MTLYFARHGESEANVGRIYSNRGRKHPLTKNGILQAERFAQSVESVPFSRIYTSPVLRAVQTSEIIAERLDVSEILETEALREFDVGDWEDQPYTDERLTTFEGVMRRWLLHEEWETRIGNGESYIDMRERFTPFIERLITASYEEDGHILFVGHGGLYACMLPCVHVNVSRAFTFERRLGNTEVAVSDLVMSELICRRWGGVEMPKPPVR